MKNSAKAATAIMAVFPTQEAFHRFAAVSENGTVLDSIIDFACRAGIIGEPVKESLAAFIQANDASVVGGDFPRHLTLEGLLEGKEELLKVKFSLRALTDRINALLAEVRITLPKVSNSMLTRLKKEPVDTHYKQNVLRSLAFWLGHERGELGTTWNYEVLLRLCRESRQSDNYREGVRVGFALYSRGDFIDHDVVGWLRKALKQYLELKLDHFLHGRWGKVRSHDITTLYIDLPKEEESDDPAAYRQCLRSAVFIAHHIVIRWSLSEYCSKKRFLSVGIVAGEFGGIDNYLLPILNAKLPGDPVIRVSDFSRQCLLINDIRVILSKRPTEISLFSGESLSIWAILSLWNFIYFDFVPDLLADRNLGTGSESVTSFNRLIWFPEEATAGENDALNAVRTFLCAPHNSLLGIEIAKTLYFRRRFTEAMEILRIVLSMEPADLVARTLRMVVFRNMALDACSLSLAENLFRMAEQEGLQIVHSGLGQSEDFYCEFGIVSLARALTLLKYSRSGVSSRPGGDPLLLKGQILDWLDRSEELLERGLTISPSGIRSAYLLGSVRILQAVLRDDDEIFTEPGRRVEGKAELIREQSLNLFRQRGYQLSDLLAKEEFELLDKLLSKKTKIHNDSISLQAYRPSIYFTSAVALWDYLHLRTVATARKVIRLIREAIESARIAAADNVCIYSFSRIYGEIMSADEFISHMEKALEMIEEVAGGELAGRDDDEVIASKQGGASLLMTLNL